MAPEPVKKVSLGEFFSRRKAELQNSTKDKAAGSMTKGPARESESNKLLSMDGESVVKPDKDESEPLLEGRQPSAQ